MITTTQNNFKMEGRKFCPRCRSIDIKINITASSVFGVPQSWVCNNCGYSNVVFPELNKLKAGE